MELLYGACSQSLLDHLPEPAAGSKKERSRHISERNDRRLLTWGPTASATAVRPPRRAPYQPERRVNRTAARVDEVVGGLSSVSAVVALRSLR